MLDPAQSAARVVLCPGQGAQAVGMGRAWYDRSPEARAIFDRADRLVGDRLDPSRTLSRLCFEGPPERLNQTDVSQPAIYVCSVASWAGLLAGWGAGGAPGASVKEAGVLATAGLSLGEYTALHLAGAFSFEAGLELVLLRGRAMQDAADAVRNPDGTPGSGMVALIGADEAQAAAVCDQARGPDVLVPANFNAPGQVVISGHISACRRAVEVAGTMGLRATALPVAGAFHSPIMKPAADRLRTALAATPMHPPSCTVYSNVTAAAHEPGVDSIRSRLVEQLTMPVLWDRGCKAMIAGLAGRGGGVVEFHELAPGKTLAGLMRRIDKSTKVDTHDEPV
ncbi:MAG: ACP S-malonyltransferase [Phycisphaerales bacterium]